MAFLLRAAIAVTRTRTRLLGTAVASVAGAARTRPRLFGTAAAVAGAGAVSAACSAANGPPSTVEVAVRADNIATAALKLSLKPMVIVVLDARGEVVAYKHKQGTGLDAILTQVHSDAAFRRARGALQISSGRAPSNPAKARSLLGGVPVLGANGELCGAVGVAGDDLSDDYVELYAAASVHAAGMGTSARLLVRLLFDDAIDLVQSVSADTSGSPCANRS